MRKSILGIGLGLGLALTACQDASGPNGDRLSRAEALQLTAQVLASSESAATASMQTSGGTDVIAAGPPTTFTQTHQSTHPCPSGGQLAIDYVLSGSWDDATNSLQADLEGTHTHTACAIPHGGVTFTLTGEPALDFAASIGAVNGQPSQPFTHSIDGALRWETSDGRSGLCVMQIQASTDFVAKQRVVQGSVCGHTVTQTTTWS